MLEGPVELDERLGLTQRLSGGLLESLESLAHGVGVNAEVLGRQSTLRSFARKCSTVVRMVAPPATASTGST
jgi:hypothetical protein